MRANLLTIRQHGVRFYGIHTIQVDLRLAIPAMSDKHTPYCANFTAHVIFCQIHTIQVDLRVVMPTMSDKHTVPTLQRMLAFVRSIPYKRI